MPDQQKTQNKDWDEHSTIQMSIFFCFHDNDEDENGFFSHSFLVKNKVCYNLLNEQFGAHHGPHTLSVSSFPYRMEFNFLLSFAYGEI